jgi:FKBP-type peptidyl-prolyl cis-trans isomerase FkpA
MTRKLAVTALLLAAVAATGACQAKKEEEKKAAAAAGPAGKSEDEKTVYSIGVMMGRQIASFGLTPSELEALKQGVSDSASGKKPEVDLETYGPKIQAFAQARAAKAAETEKTKSTAYADNAAKEAGAVKSPSGLVFKTLTPGTGKSPSATDLVKVHYHGTLTSGEVFDSSVTRGQPVDFALNSVIPCWTEGVQKMKVGEKARLVCPSSIAYGDQGRPPTIPGGATLVFEVELLGIKGK